MHQVAPGVWQLAGFATRWINVFVIGDVLIDAATRWAGGRIIRQLGDRRLSLLAVLEHGCVSRADPDPLHLAE